MYKYIPQKKRSALRIKLGVLFYSTLRYFFWIRHNSEFATLASSKKYQVKNKINLSSKNGGLVNSDWAKKEFSFTAYSDSSDLYRNLSRDDSAMQDGKVDNLFVALKYIDGIILEPGKVFSYWKLLGRPTKAKGYKKGMMLVNGKPVAKTAGGLCALSNLIYWITLHTNLTVIERFRHSYDVFPDSNRTRPFGSGATCVYNYRDLMIRNETSNTYRLELKIENNKLYATWKTIIPQIEQYKVYEKDHHFTQEAAGVFVRHNSIYRIRIDQQFTERNTRNHKAEEYITENHALMMYQPFITDDSDTKSSEEDYENGSQE